MTYLLTKIDIRPRVPETTIVGYHEDKDVVEANKEVLMAARRLGKDHFWYEVREVERL